MSTVHAQGKSNLALVGRPHNRPALPNKVISVATKAVGGRAPEALESVACRPGIQHWCLLLNLPFLEPREAALQMVQHDAHRLALRRSVLRAQLKTLERRGQHGNGHEKLPESPSIKK